MAKRLKRIISLVIFVLILLEIGLWNTSSYKHKQHNSNVKYFNFKTRVGNIQHILPEQVNVRQTGQLEVRHIVFLKVHKCASSTMINIFYRFGSTRNLTFVLPENNNYILYSGSYTNILPPTQNRTFDILTNHAIFSPDLFMNIMPLDTVYIGIVREPYERLYSAFVYYRIMFPTDYLNSISKQTRKHSQEDIIRLFSTYINDPLEYEPFDPYASKTNNRMAIDFGYPVKDFNNETKFREYLNSLNRYLDLVLVKEMFDESVILMRRLLNWKIKDVMYIPKNRMKSPSAPLLSNETLARVKSFLHLDYILYDHFLKQLHQLLQQQEDDFYAEVRYFKIIQTKFKAFCLTKSTNVQPGESEILFPATKWNEMFIMNSEDCRRTKLSELSFVKRLRNVHTDRLRRVGENKQWSSSRKYRLISKRRYSKKR